jgi:hypothetical protein
MTERNRHGKIPTTTGRRGSQKIHKKQNPRLDTIIDDVDVMSAMNIPVIMIMIILFFTHSNSDCRSSTTDWSS